VTAASTGPGPAVELGALTFDAADALALAQFWATVWQTTCRPATVLPGAAVIDAGPGHPTLLFLPVPESKAAKNRCHPDLHTADVDTVVATAQAAGATKIAEFRHPGHWVVLTDPEGNEFCIVEDLGVGAS
jgi:predicted enzyme related to lactoylglutathione lyase